MAFGTLAKCVVVLSVRPSAGATRLRHGAQSWKRDGNGRWYDENDSKNSGRTPRVATVSRAPRAGPPTRRGAVPVPARSAAARITAGDGTVFVSPPPQAKDGCASSSQESVDVVPIPLRPSEGGRFGFTFKSKDNLALRAVSGPAKKALEKAGFLEQLKNGLRLDSVIIPGEQPTGVKFSDIKELAKRDQEITFKFSFKPTPKTPEELLPPESCTSSNPHGRTRKVTRSLWCYLRRCLMVFLFGTLGSFLNFAYRRKNILTALVPDQDDPRLEPNKIENIFFFSLTETSKKLSDFIQDHFSLVAGSIFVSSVYMFFHCWDMKCDLNYGLTKDAEVEVLGVKGKLVDGPCCGQCTRSEIPKVKFSKSVEPPSESELTWDTVKIAPNGRKDIIGRGGFCGSISCCKMGSLCCRDSNGLKCVGWVCPSAISGVSPFSARGRRFVHQRLFRLIFGFGRFCGVGSVGDKEKEEVQINYDQSWKDFAKTTPEFRIGLGAFIFMFCVALFDLFIVLFERESESQLQTRTSKCTCFFGLEVDTVDNQTRPRPNIIRQQ